MHTLRQQMVRESGRPNLALADFVAPKETGIADYIGGFAVTAGLGEDEHIKRFEADKDDYTAILLRALADRLAEAFAERMHQRVRREFWGYAADEALTNEELIAEKYRGIRPAPGYPAQPDHTEKGTLFDLLDAENAPASRSPKAMPCGRARRCRASISRIPKAAISASARSSAIRSRITPSARAGTCRRRTLAVAAPQLRSARQERGVVQRQSCPK